MDRALSDVIITVAAVLILTGGGLLAYWLAIRANREERHELIAEEDDFQAELEALRAEMNTQIAELHERLDFAERLLASHSNPPLARADAALDEKTPREL